MIARHCPSIDRALEMVCTTDRKACNYMYHLSHLPHICKLYDIVYCTDNHCHWIDFFFGGGVEGRGRFTQYTEHHPLIKADPSYKDTIAVDIQRTIWHLTGA